MAAVWPTATGKNHVLFIMDYGEWVIFISLIIITVVFIIIWFCFNKERKMARSPSESVTSIPTTLALGLTTS